MRKLLLAAAAIMAQLLCATAQRSVSGIINDPSGNSIAGATVLVNGSSVKVVSSVDGTFSVSLPTSDAQLIVVASGFEKQVVATAYKTFLTIVLTPSYKELRDVVFTGYARTKKSRFTGASTRIESDEIQNRPFSSLDQMLQGRVPGVLVSTPSGQPGTAASVIIRGRNSIRADYQPLYILDGIPIEKSVFVTLNPTDIASVNILRDAASQALYGSRGSAGVIVITTKRGAAGKARIHYSGQIGVKSVLNYAYRPMNTNELLSAQLKYGQATGDNFNPLIPGWFLSQNNPRYAGLTPLQQQAASRSLDSLRGINTNWQNEFYRRGTFSDHNLSVSGGTGKVNYFTSIGLYNEEGIIASSDMKRITLRNNIDISEDRFSLSLSTHFGYSKRNSDASFPGYISNFNSFMIPLIAAPYSQVRNADGSLNLFGSAGNAYNIASQYLDIKEKDKYYENQIRGILGVTAGYQISARLQTAITTGIDFRENQNTVYEGRDAYVRTPAALGPNPVPTSVAGSITEGVQRNVLMNVRHTLSYSQIIKQKHDVQFTGGVEYIQENTKGIQLKGYGIDPRTPNTAGVIVQGNSTNQLYAEIANNKNLRSESALLSGFLMANYTYANKFTFSGSVRRDGSSKLSSQNRWQHFYSLGGLWDIKQEKFLNRISFINTLRLRASIGNSGNADNFPRTYLYQSTYTTSTYSGLPSQIVGYPGNPNAKWEVTRTINVGTDFAVWNKRIYGDLNWYNRKTKGLFVPQRLSAEAGGKVIDVNAGSLQNTGFEWSVNVDVLRNKQWNITLFSTGAYNKNKLLSTNGGEPFTNADGVELYEEGKPLGNHYLVKWAGVDASTGQPLYYDKNGNLTNVFQGSNAVTGYGTWEAPWKGGFGTVINFKNISFSMLFSWQKGATKIDNLEYFTENPSGFMSAGFNQSSSMVFWTQPGDVVNTPSPLYAVSPSSKLVHDASFLRLRDLIISYDFPAEVITKAKYLKGVKVFAQATNLFLWTKWRGSDPEAGGTFINGSNPGVNLGEFPNPRSFNVGVNVTL